MGSFADTTYPREGTETQAIAGMSRLLTCDTTYPREGTETAAVLNGKLLQLDTTYPREGTETIGIFGRLLSRN